MCDIDVWCEGRDVWIRGGSDCLSLLALSCPRTSSGIFLYITLSNMILSDISLSDLNLSHPSSPEAPSLRVGLEPSTVEVKESQGSLNGDH